MALDLRVRPDDALTPAVRESIGTSHNGKPGSAVRRSLPLRQKLKRLAAHRSQGRRRVSAAEFARWYSATGGLHHPNLGGRAGAVVSFSTTSRWTGVR